MTPTILPDLRYQIVWKYHSRVQIILFEKVIQRKKKMLIQD